MAQNEQSLDNLWLAQILFEMGAVEFGEFTLSETTVKSPIYINPKLLVSNPGALRVANKLTQQEITLAQSLRRPKCHSFDLVAGVPVGGLHLATAYSLETNCPLIYARIPRQGVNPSGHSIEGRYHKGDTVLIIDDLITKGGSIIETAKVLEDAGLVVKDVIVLVDREQGAAARLHARGYNLMTILKLDVMLNMYMARGYISEDQYRRASDYVGSNQAHPTS